MKSGFRGSGFGCWVLSAALFLLAGCSAGPKFLIKDFQPPRAIAVLPFANETNDVEGPESVRKLLIELLPRRGYAPMNEETVDRTLREKLGITEGGQLGSVTAQEIGQELGCDGLMYGNLLTFMDLPLGYVRKRTVKADLKLVDSRTGNVLWEDEKSWTTPEFHFNSQEAKRAASWQVADRQMRKIAGTLLREESILMLERALKNLPLKRFRLSAD